MDETDTKNEQVSDEVEAKQEEKEVKEVKEEKGKEKEKETTETEREEEVEETKKLPLRSLTAILQQNEAEKPAKDKTYNAAATNLEELGYHYNSEGQLRSISSNSKFEFIDQKHYDLLGDFVVTEIQRKMLALGSLEVSIPLDAGEKDSRSNIFISNDFYENKSTLLVIICGSGAVRAGMWARSLCINDSLETGSVIPYLRLAKERGYSYIVLNPNFTRNGDIPVANADTPQKHVSYCWNNLISPSSQASKIAIVAHSFGGVCTQYLIQSPEFPKKDRARLACIAFTDSVHSVGRNGFKFEQPPTINWVRSNKPLDTVLGKSEGVNAVSSGTTIHEYTSAYSIKSVFNFIDDSIVEKKGIITRLLSK